MEEKPKQLLQEWKEEIDRRMLGAAVGDGPDILYEPIEYVVSGEGKRIRPILLLLAAQAVGGEIERCWDAAVAMELLHNFTLVHDDIMDEDDTRRGRPTVHKKWNLNISLLSGDGLLALAYRSLFKTRTPALWRVADIFTDGLLEICEGQALDLAFELRSDVSLNEYMEMIGKKTARLLTMAAMIGAIIGEGTEEQVQALGDFAFNMGLAFQIQDDVLDIMSDERTIGKSYGSDVKKKKQTFLMIYALQHAGPAERKRIGSYFESKHVRNSDVAGIKEVFEQTGAVHAAKRSIANHLTVAEAQLSCLQGSLGKDLLLSFLQRISSRNA